MLPRKVAARFLFRVVQGVEKSSIIPWAPLSRCAMGASRCFRSYVTAPSRVPAIPDLWLWQRKLLQWHHQDCHHPCTTTRMYSASILQGTQQLNAACTSLWMVPNHTLKESHICLYSSKPPSVPSSVDDNQNEKKELPCKEEKVTRKVEVSRNIKTEEKLSIVQKFKLMYKHYWYVLIPVHIVTSIVWYGSFFIAAKSGVDIIPLMEKLGAGEKILSHLQSSNAGYYAIAYAMYKIATPARYTVTVGGTTISINYLKKRGYIKPVPSSEKLKEMYEGKKEEFIERKEEFVEKYQERREEILDRYQERREELIDKYQEKREEIKEKYQETKGEMVQKLSEKREELKEKVTEKTEKIKGRLEERKDQLNKVRRNTKKR